MAKSIRIPLTDAAPVSIDPEIWPVVAVARWHDGQIESQATRRARLTVRCHADGRSLVTGWSTSQFQGEGEFDAGEIVAAGGDVIAAIHRTAETIGREHLAQECIQDLPAVDLT